MRICRLIRKIIPNYMTPAYIRLDSCCTTSSFTAEALPRVHAAGQPHPPQLAAIVIKWHRVKATFSIARVKPQSLPRVTTMHSMKILIILFLYFGQFGTPVPPGVDVEPLYTSLIRACRTNVLFAGAPSHLCPPLAVGNAVGLLLLLLTRGREFCKFSSIQ